jgi:uncharacterized protein (TIGR03435 family)
MRSAAIFVLLLVGAVRSAAQSPPTAAVVPTFEVASIRENRSGAPNSGIDMRGRGRFIGSNQTARGLVRFAFPEYRDVVGLPPWAMTLRYDVNATAGRDATRAEILQMIRALLEERFHLRTHVSPREEDIYELRLGHDGRFSPGLTPSSVDCEAASDEVRRGGQPVAANGAPACGASLSADGIWRYSGRSMDGIASVLSGPSGRAVINRTGVPGLFDLTLKYSPNPDQPINDFPSIFTAAQELGLRLHPTHGTVKVLAVDQIERPTTD